MHNLYSPNSKRSYRIQKNGEEFIKNISYKLQVIDSAKFMASSLSNLVNNLSEEVDRIKWKFEHEDKKCEICGINLSLATVFLNTQTLRMI